MQTCLKTALIIMLLVLLFSCELFVKRNPGDFDTNKKSRGHIGYVGFYPVSFSGMVMNMKISADNKYLVAIDSAYNIYQMEINKDGFLDLKKNLNMETLFYPFTLDSSNNLYIIKKNLPLPNNQVSIYNDDFYLSDSINTDASSDITDVMISPDKKNFYAFISGASSAPVKTYGYFIDAGGSIRPIGIFNLNHNADPVYYKNITITGDGEFIYFFETAGSCCYDIYQRDPQSGALFTAASGLAVPYSLGCPVISNDQKYLYGINKSASPQYLMRLTRNKKTGVLSNDYQIIFPENSTDDSCSFNSIALSKDNKKLYCAFSTSSGVYFECLDIDSKTMEFTYSSASLGIFEIAVLNNDRYIYAGCNDRILIFERFAE